MNLMAKALTGKLTEKDVNAPSGAFSCKSQSAGSMIDALSSVTAASFDPTGNDEDEIIVTLHFPKEKATEARLVLEMSSND